MAGVFSERLHRASLGARMITALVGIPLMFVALWYGGGWWTGLTAVLALLGWIEFSHLLALGWQLRGLLLTGVAALFTLTVWGSRDLVTLLLVMWFPVLWGYGFVPYFWRRDLDSYRRFWKTTGLLLGAFYLAMSPGVLARWRLESGMWSLLIFLLVIWASDTAAYFVGLAVGRHKLAPRLSPGKSWEGGAAGTSAGALVGVVGSSFLTTAPLFGLLFGIATSIASQIGDLFESAVKRKAGVKDSGTLLPGHGGILDRFDGILLAAPIAYILVRAWAR